jgi:hypothetical protein
VTDIEKLEQFVRQVAELRRDGEDDGEGEEYESENDDNFETLYSLIVQARELLGLPDPLYPLDEAGAA